MDFHYGKIIATLGPSIEKETVLSKIISKVDIFRINLSHWDLQKVKKYVEIVRNIDSSKAIMLDTKGPEIRVKNKNEICLKPRSKIYMKFSAVEVDNLEDEIYIDFAYFEDIPKDCIISIDDNKILFQVKKISTDVLELKPLICGVVKPWKSVNFREYTPAFSSLTDEDKKAILWWIENKISLLAVSFVRDKKDLQEVRDFLYKNGGGFMKIVSKIETSQALENIDEIISYSDAVMIARWDLGSVIPLEYLPKAQMEIIQKCNKYGKPVIIATQILDSMISSPVPTRAEVDEVVYNIKNWADAFMLSGETAIGDYPIETVNWLYNIINSNFDIYDWKLEYKDLIVSPSNKITDYIIYSAYKAIKDLGIKAIICPTETWYTPSRLSTLKPPIPIIAFTTNDITFKYLNLLWWVKGYKISKDFDYLWVKKLAKEIVINLFRGEVGVDDKILIVHSSIATNTPGMINWLEILKFKDI